MPITVRQGRGKDCLFLSLLVAAALTLYYRVFSFYFAIDDYDFLGWLFYQRKDFSMQSFARFTSQMCMKPEMFRPLVGRYFWEYMLFGSSPQGYFAVLLFDLVLLVCAVYYLARLITGNAAAGFLAALFFLIHPLQKEAISVAANSQFLAAFFACVSLICVVKCVRGSGAKYGYASAFFSLCSVLGWQGAIVIPLVGMVYASGGGVPGKNNGLPALFGNAMVLLSYSVFVVCYTTIPIAAKCYEPDLARLYNNSFYFSSALMRPFFLDSWWNGLAQHQYFPRALVAGTIVLCACASCVILLRSRGGATLKKTGFLWGLLCLGIVPFLFLNNFLRNPHDLLLSAIPFFMLQAWAVTLLFGFCAGRRSIIGTGGALVLCGLVTGYIVSCASLVSGNKVFSHQIEGQTVMQLTSQVKKMHPAFPASSNVYLVDFPGAFAYNRFRDVLRFSVCVPISYHDRSMRVSVLTGAEFRKGSSVVRGQPRTYVFRYRGARGVEEIYSP